MITLLFLSTCILHDLQNLPSLTQVSMDIMREFSIPVPKGFMATSAAEAASLYTQNIGKDVPVVLKAMVLAG